MGIMRIVITGGHHSSAIPVIYKLRERSPDVQISWIGHRHSAKNDASDTLEFKEITNLNIPFYDLKAGKIYKTYDVVRWLKVPYGFFQALYLLNKIKPDVILSFGGYLAVPVVIAGRLFGIPSITHEQTTVAGYANKVISHFASKILISWKNSEKFFPKEKIVYTGVPIRKSIFEIKTNVFDVKNGLPTIYITAGKTGSHKINEVIKEALPHLLDFCNVIHQCGENTVYKDYDQLNSIYQEIKRISRGDYFLRKFVLEDEIGAAFARSSLVVSRAGAHTITELMWLRKPCILIPISWVSHNEQFENAKLLEECGIGKILNEDNLNSETLVSEIKTSLNTLKKFTYSQDNSNCVLVQNADELIADEIYKTLKERQ